MAIIQWYWLLSVVFVILYGALILWFWNGWKNLSGKAPVKSLYNTRLTVLVPYHNEEAHLPALCGSLMKQELQTRELEFILVNDHSTDRSVQLAQAYAKKDTRIHLVNSPAKGKKQALLAGIEAANGDFIVCTDADCQHPTQWLATFLAYYEHHHPKLLLGPVTFKSGKGFFHQFQSLELISLVSSTAGAVGIKHPIMCNGANLAFEREAFLQLDDPYRLEYLSGDDVFLLHAMKKEFPDAIHFIKDQAALVETQHSTGFGAYLKQKARWASKASGYKDRDTNFTAGVVGACSALLVVGLLGLPFELKFYQAVLFIWLSKILIDGLFLRQTMPFFGQPKLLKFIPLFEWLHALNILYASLAGIFAKRKW